MQSTFNTMALSTLAVGIANGRKKRGVKAGKAACHGRGKALGDGSPKVKVKFLQPCEVSKAELVEPIDYETVIVKNKTVLKNDPQTELLLFLHDDVSISKLPRKFRTTRSSVPPDAPEVATGLLVKESIKSYTSSWHSIHYKYSAYSGSYKDLPGGKPPDVLPQQVFEVDAEDNEEQETNQRNGTQQITKQGWLYKGPDNGLETSIMSFTKSFKRRYFYLKRQADMTYMMEFFKDEKKLDAKGSIFMDSAVSVARSSRRGKHAFELHMQNKNFYLFAAETEGDMDSWVTTLTKVIQSNDAFSVPSLERFREKDCESSPGKGGDLQESLEHSMNPELQKYARETDNILALKRKEGRQKLFCIYPEIQRSLLSPCGSIETEAAVYREQFGTRFIVECNEFQLRLQVNLSEDSNTKLTNPEPFFITLALYDAREEKKISEDFHFDPNAEKIRSMIPNELLSATDMLNSVNGAMSGEPDLYGIDPKWLAYCDRAIFNVVRPHHEIFLVARIEKVLQGSINSAVDPYMRNPDEKLATKIHRQMALYCSKLGHYRMPFAWGARPVFQQKNSDELDMNAGFALYKTDRSKMSEDEIIRHLQDIKKPEKQGKWQPILGSLVVRLKPFNNVLHNTLTSSLVPVTPFPSPPSSRPTLEVEPFSLGQGELASPFTTYVNHLYVYPRTLKYDSQKVFAKARNIACYVEIRDSDSDGAVPLKCIRGRPGSSLFTTCATTAVLHHDSTPDFIEEVKACLPTQLHDRHHLVFTFSHVSCDLSKTAAGKGSTKKAMNLDAVIGYAWFPLLTNGRVNVGEQAVRVAINLPPGYLQHEQLGLGKGCSGPEIRWVDSGRPLFRFDLGLVSTIYTKDQHLHNFFAHCQKMISQPSLATDFETSNKLKLDPKMTSPTSSPVIADLADYNREMLNYVKSLHAVDVSTLINFLPTLLNQLYRLLPLTQSEDVALNTIRVLVHVVSEIHAVGKPQSLDTYVEYVFVTPLVTDTKQKTIHEELVRHLKAILLPRQADLLVITKLLRHADFFFRIILKAMAQFLLNTGRVKMARNERFPSSFQYHVQTLVQTFGSHLVQKFRDHTAETRKANTSVANFVKQCFTFMDRGFVFRLINMYIDNFHPADPRILHEYKFEFLRIVCSHEFYIPLCLPIMTRKVKNYKDVRQDDLKHDYTLSTEFRRNHFLVGLLLQEVKASLSEDRDIRTCAINTLRNLLAKHSFDDRYQTKAHQARISTLYLPFITVILENKSRLIHNESQVNTPSDALVNGEALTPDGSLRHGAGMVSNSSSVSLEAQSGHSPHHTRIMRDPGVLAIISGQVPTPTLAAVAADATKMSDHGSSSSLCSTTSHSSVTEREGREHAQTHHRTCSVPESMANTTNASYIGCYDKLDQHEVKDMLICFLSIVSNLSEEILLGWFNNSSEYDVIDFFDILESCLKYFRYAGRRRIASLCMISDTKRALTLPVKMTHQQLHSHGRSSSTTLTDMPLEGFLAGGNTDMNELNMEANLSTEVAMVVLDVVCLYTSTFKNQLKFQNGDNPIMQRVFDLHLHFLQTHQSEMVLRHAFAALRSFISKFPPVLFVGEATMCGQLCYEILRCCNLRLTSTRREACALMYLLMRSNFEFSKRKNFTRVHLQMIISVSQLISAVVALSNSRFSESLSVINSYANNDKAIQKTSFPIEVKDLTKRIRTVLMATAAMKEHQSDPEVLIDLQYSLAKSYATTPELRKTWLESMARIHVKNGNFSEAAHCYLHIAALVAEYLRRRGDFPQGCSAFACLSSNVKREETAMQDDFGMQDVHYTKDHLTELLEQCAELMEKAERYELLGRLYRLIIPIYELNRDFKKLAHAYELLHRAYSKVVDVMQSGRRLLGKYFRVALFGAAFEEDDGKEYIYKEPKITGLTEICERLKDLYTAKFGKGCVQLIMDSAQVNVDGLDQKFAYIQVTHVTPYFDKPELEQRKTEFERNNNLKQFMYETPFTRDGRAHGQINEQCKRRVVLTTDHSFPYIKKRLLVYYRRQEELSPIEVAIDVMTNKVSELNEVVSQPQTDVKKLQLKLQGSISVQVNAGPVAYADVFLDDDNIKKFPRDKVTALKDIFRDFVNVCSTALDLNGRLICSDQLEYQESLRINFGEMTERLAEIFGEPLLEQDDDAVSMTSHRGSVTVFNVISATSSASAI